MPRPYHRKISNLWWLKRWPYTKFMLRELSSVIVAIYLVVLLRHVGAVQAGPKTYEAFAASMSSGGWWLFHLVALAASLFHTITWFLLASQAMVLHRGEERVPPKLVQQVHFAAWAVVSLVVLGVFLVS